ncbi:UNVERIFIED_ORG: hypothetical protein M2414_004115 [Rahnella aquatilis]
MAEKYMKHAHLLSLLALVVSTAHAAYTPVELSANLTLSTPQCTISVTPESDTLAASYTLEPANITNNTPGTYSFATSTASYLVTTNESCGTLPGFKFKMPTPVERVGSTYEKQVTAHGVAWRTNAFLVNMVAHTTADGNGTARDAIGKLNYKSSNGTTYNESIGRGAPVSYQARGGGDYVPSVAGNVRHTSSGSWYTSSNGPVVASSATGYLNTVTPTLTATDASMVITLGALFDKSGPLVGSAYDQGAVVNGLDYSWTGTLTVTPL